VHRQASKKLPQLRLPSASYHLFSSYNLTKLQLFRLKFSTLDLCQFWETFFRFFFSLFQERS